MSKAILYQKIAETGVALLLGLLLGALLMTLYGYNSILAYSSLFAGAFGSIFDLAETLSFAMPIMLTALTFAIGIKAGFFNIGAEGQLYLGAIGAIIVGGLFILPPGLHLIVTIFAAMAFGALWSIVPALLKIFRGVHEVISTIMFNWMAYYFVMYLALYHLAEPGRSEKTISVLETARFDVIMPGTTLTGAVFVSIVFTLMIFAYLSVTRSGFELRILGAGADSAKYAGINIKKVTLTAFILGGLAAGLAGGLQIIGKPPTYALYGTLGNIFGLGFDGIGVALIGRNHPLGIIFASIFYGGLQHGGRYMEYQAGVASELVRAVNGLIIISLAVPELIRIIMRIIKR
jgi:simple sugar transport system permease protein